MQIRGIEVVNNSHYSDGYVREHVLDALDIAKYQGWTLDLDKITVGWYQPERSMGCYYSSDHSIKIKGHALGNDETLIHEIAHHVHYLGLLGEHRGITMTEFESHRAIKALVTRWRNGGNEWRTVLRQHVSIYAAFNAAEAVAETACNFILGRDVGPAMHVYEELGGPPLRKP